MSRGRAADLKLDRVPTELIDVTDMRFPKSAEMFIPDGLEPEFTRVEFSAASHLRGRNLWAALKVLEHLGSIRRVQSSGNRITYRISDRNHA